MEPDQFGCGRLTSQPGQVAKQGSPEMTRILKVPSILTCLRGEAAKSTAGAAQHLVRVQGQKKDDKKKKFLVTLKDFKGASAGNRPEVAQPCGVCVQPPKSVLLEAANTDSCIEGPIQQSAH